MVSRVVIGLVLCLLATTSLAVIPVIIETDIGTEMDDTWALGFLLASPEVDIQLIITSTEDTVQRAQIVAKFLTTVGRSDIPIAIGHNYGEDIGPQYQYATDYSLNSYAGKISSHPISEIMSVIEANPVVTYLELSPPAVFAQVIEANATLVSERVRLVSMSGSIHRGYNGSKTHVQEYNVHYNISAAQTMYREPYYRMPLLSAPLDTAGVIALGPSYYNQLVAAQVNNKLITNILLNYRYASGTELHKGSTVLCDVEAAWLVMSTQYLTCSYVPVEVTDDGYTLVNSTTGSPTLMALEWAKGGIHGFQNEITQRLLAWTPTASS